MDEVFLAPGHGLSANLVERRLSLRLFSYWERLRGDRSMPREDEIEPDGLQDLWEDSFLLRVEDIKKQNYRYSYLGDNLRNAYIAGLSEVDMENLPVFDASQFSAEILKVISTVRPCITEAEFTNDAGYVIKYRQCLLPLGRAGKVEGILGGMRYRVCGHVTRH